MKGLDYMTENSRCKGQRFVYSERKFYIKRTMGFNDGQMVCHMAI